MRLRISVSLVLAVAALLPALLALNGRVRNIVKTPFAPESLPWQQIPMEFSYDDYAGRPGRHTARIQLYLRDPTALVVHDEVNVLLGAYGTSPRLVEGRLMVSGTSCTYHTRPDASLVENSYLTLVRGSQCRLLRGVATGGVELVIEFDGVGRLGAWGAVPPEPSADPATIYISQMQVPVGWRPVLHGYYADIVGSSSHRRVDMLGYVWRLGTAPAWIWGALLVNALVLAAGMAAMPLNPVQHERRATLRSGLAAACIAGAVASTYAVVVPPFQAPDEPDHLLSYAFATTRWNLTTDARNWARTIHFDRVRLSPHEQFSPWDVGRPLDTPWNPLVIFEEDVEARSGSTFTWWQIASRVIDPHRGTDARGGPATLLALRLANALLFALAVGAGTAFVVWTAIEIPFPQLACFVFLFVPTLPFFAMHLSEYAILTSGYVLLACGLLALFLDGPRSHGAGAAIGVASGLVFASGRSAFPILPMIAAALLARAIAGSRHGRPAVRRAAIFWSGLLAAIPVFMLCAGERYRAQISTLVLAYGPEAAGDLLQRGPLVLIAAAVGAAVAAAGVEIAFAAIRSRVRGPTALGRAGARLLACALAAAIVWSVGASWRASAMPHPVSAESPARPEADVYVAQVLATMATTFRLREPDAFLSSSFWGGFGWLETRIADPLVTAMVAATALAWLALIVYLGIRAEGRRIVWMVLLVAGSAASVYLYALNSYALYRNVHGRYLVGFYLVLLAMMWSLPIVAAPRTMFGRARVWVLLGGCIAIHAWAWSWLIRRYF